MKDLNKEPEILELLSEAQNFSGISTIGVDANAQKIQHICPKRDFSCVFNTGGVDEFIVPPSPWPIGPGMELLGIECWRLSLGLPYYCFLVSAVSQRLAAARQLL